MEKSASIDYDFEEDILSVFKSDNVQDSIRMGGIILDFDHNRRICGVEIMDAVEFFKDYGVSKEDLKSISKANIRVSYSRNGQA